MSFKELDAKMRVYEQSLDQTIPPGNYLLARIDGRNFTRLTKEICKFEKPFDDRFSQMMVETAKSLVTDTGMEIILGQPAVFDCRIIPLPNQELVADYFRWRMEDAHRNCLNSWCYWTGHNPSTGQDVPTTRREVFVDYDLPKGFVPF